jgi:hypothetical protein
MITNIHMEVLKRHWPGEWKELQGIADGFAMDVKSVRKVNEI